MKPPHEKFLCTPLIKTKM